MVLAAMTAGIAKITMNDVTSCAQTSSGMRSRDIPGARFLKIVVMRFVALASAESSVNVTTCDQMSIRLPGECSGPDRGTYANQPASGPVFAKSATYRRSPPTTYVQ
jgi:hypothetical protein